MRKFRLIVLFLFSLSAILFSNFCLGYPEIEAHEISNLLLSQAPENQAEKVRFLENIPLFYLGTIGSLLAGLMTGIGGLPVLFVSKVSERIQGILLGFAAGVMLAATSFSLLLPSIKAASQEGNSFNAANIVITGTLLGGLFLWLTHRYFPYKRYIQQPQGSNLENLKGIWLFIIAIALHNFPEGLAVGVGFGGGDLGNGLALAIGIGLQNLPEGLAVALALITENYSRTNAFWIALLTGLLEPVGGIVGAGVISLGEALLPWGMSLAAGAMLFVICDAIIPDSQQLGGGKEVTAGIMIGFAVMMYLDVTLG